MNYDSKIYVLMRCKIWCHLCNLKNVKNTHGGVLLLVKLQASSCTFTKSNIHRWVFFTILKLSKWYQITQRITIYFIFKNAVFSIVNCFVKGSITNVWQGHKYTLAENHHISEGVLLLKVSMNFQMLDGKCPTRLMSWV